MPKKRVLSVWYCATCQMSVVVPGHPRRLRHARCRHWMSYQREIRPAPNTG
jgi:hypothetical protein